MARKTAAERYAARKIRVAADAADRADRDALLLAAYEWRANNIDPFEDEWARIVETHNQSKAVR